MTSTPSSPSPREPVAAHYADDEISLIDLAKLLVRRWKAMAGIFVVVVLIALAYALMHPPVFTYTSIYQVAERDAGQPLETPASLVARAQTLYLGPVTRELIDDEGLQRLPFETEISTPENTQTVKLATAAPEAQVDRVKAHHQALLERLADGQQRLLERRRQALERQLASVDETISQRTQSSDAVNTELLSRTMKRKFQLEAELAGLLPGEAAQVAVQSLERQGTSRALILALGVVLGGMLAVMGVFILHFISLVRESLREDTG